MKIKDVMSPMLETIEPDTTLRVAAQKMKALDVGSLPVKEGGKLVGMITDRDIVIRATADGAEPNSARVRESMTPVVICCSEDQDVEAAAQMMEEKKIRRIPVVNSQQHPVGILSLGDVAVRSPNTQLAGKILREVAEEPSVAGMPAKRHG